jgi:Protein of unknown function (DUF1553)/Protein of unknown function (DUF1549)/Planctomycete cytochrome C
MAWLARAFHRVGIVAVCILAGQASRAAEQKVSFNRDVRPILSENCFTCHGLDQNKRKGGLRLDRKEDAFKPGDSGDPAIVPGKPEASQLIARATSHDDDDRMPPKKSGAKPLPARDIEVLRRWIAQGAEYQPHWAFIRPERPAAPSIADCESRIADLEKSDAARATKLRAQEPSWSSWPRNPVDQFILSRLIKEGLTPSPEASPETLCRRLYLDLTGIPPTPEEVGAFQQSEINDPRSAVESLVDQLLASPRYGERMAMAWMDGARYADSHGFQADWGRSMWQWRDWVINAYNTNMPFDQFTIEQIAGDLLPNPTIAQRVATGFNRNHRMNREGGSIAEEWLVENVIDRVETTCSVWLGLTIGCARCHDHKYDPITQKEFYQFFSFFNNIPEQGAGVGKPGNYQPVLQLPTPELKAKVEALDAQLREATANFAAIEQRALSNEKEWAWRQTEAEALSAGDGKKGGSLPADIKAILAIIPAQRTAKQKDKLLNFILSESPAESAAKKRVEMLAKERSDADDAIPSVMVMQEMETPRPAFVLLRGQYDKPGDPVSAGLPAALPPMPAGEPMNRLGLARWLVSPNNPLTARVQVNRIWERLFGVGLVKTSENLGSQADWPSNPELLDWLATELIRLKWDLKAFQKMIVTSATYRQSSRITPELLERDPENRWLARGPRFRLSAEVIRDQALAISGLLVERIGGPSVYPYMPEGVWDETNVYGNLRNYQAAKDDGLYRRTMYTIWKRTAAPPTLTLFDAPSREICTVKRSRTNTPLQALALLNEVTFVESARKLAERMIVDGGSTPEDRIRYGFLRATGRQPSKDELPILKRGFERHLADYRQNPEAAKALLKVGASKSDAALDPGELAAMTLTANVLLNLDEVVTKE